MPKTPATCHCLRLPRVLYGPATSPVRNCHVSSYGPDTCPVRTGTCLYGLYGQVQSAKSKFCLFGSADRMRYLPHTDSVCDKNYTTGIRKTSRTSWCWFRRIPSTFIFEHFSCPDGSWIRFLITRPNNRPFGPQKVTDHFDKLGIGHPACSLSLKDDYIRGSKTQ